MIHFDESSITWSGWLLHHYMAFTRQLGAVPFYSAHNARLAGLDRKYRWLEQDIEHARRITERIESNWPVLIGQIRWYEPEALRSINAKVYVSDKCIWLIE